MKLSLNKKMFGLGLLVFFAIGIMIGISQYSSSNTTDMMEVSDDANAMLNKRQEQLALLNKYEYSMIQLTLSAMDAIIDKDEGTISAERMENINKRGKFLTDNMPKVIAMADTDQEKKLAQDVGKNIGVFINTIKVDLNNAIIESARRIKEIEQAFVKIDDDLDKYGDGFNGKLETILVELHDKQLVSANAQQEAFLASSIKLHLIQVQQWLTDISATRGAKGFDDGFKEAEKHAREFRKDLKALKGISPALKSQLNGLEKSFEAFYKKGKWMARQYVKYGPARGNKAMGEFDAFAEDIGNRVQKLIDVTTANANKLSDINKGIAHVEKMLKTHLALMLAAMDSIIDKDEGKIDDARAKEINEAISFQNNAISVLRQFDKLGVSQQKVDPLVNDFSKLSEGISVDLKSLIENSTKEQKEIIELFVKFDDDLDVSAGAIEDALHDFRESVEGEVVEAKEDLSNVETRLEKDLKTNSIITWSFSLVLLAAICSLFFFFARGITRPIRYIIEGLNSGSEQVASASGQVATASQSLAEGASQQAAAIEETSSSLEEMASMTKQNADNASQADNLMKDANQVVSQANNSMTELTTSMEEISRASEETSKIIKTIDEIAFQTNLLALNAAVEAARAGEAGAGFAVVADEVRNLAMRAAEAAKDTSTLIESTVKRVNDGSELVTKTNEAFKQVAESTGKVGELVGEIAAASNEQAQGIDQVNKAVTEMDKVVQQNTASAEESASASEEMSAQANQMQSMVGELDSMISGDEKGSSSAVSRQPKLAHSTQTASPTQNKTEIKPEQIIPMDDDFSDF